MSSITVRGHEAQVGSLRGEPGYRLLASVSVIVPVGPQELLWRDLLSCFASLPIECEIWFVAAQDQPADFEEFLAKCGLERIVRWASVDVGRGSQMNAGASLSTREFLWFLHADSKVSSEAISALDKSLTAFPGAIHYFDLAFSEGSPIPTRLNAWGVWMRSHCLRLPFGDQGLCMSRDTFALLQGFREEVPYGEDHLLIWAAHRKHILLRAVGAALTTSARKYEANGWFSTTVHHLWRTWYQAIPQGVALLWSRLR